MTNEELKILNAKKEEIEQLKEHEKKLLLINFRDQKQTVPAMHKDFCIRINNMDYYNSTRDGILLYKPFLPITEEDIYNLYLMKLSARIAELESDFYKIHVSEIKK